MRHKIIYILILILTLSIASAAFTSYNVNEVDIRNVTISIDQTKEFYRYNTTVQESDFRIYQGSGSLERLIGVGTDSLGMELYINNTNFYNETLRTFEVNNRYGVFNLPHRSIQLDPGNIIASGNFTDGVSTYDILHFGGQAIFSKASNGDDLVWAVDNVSGIIPDTGGVDNYVNVLNKSFTLSEIQNLKLSTQLRTESDRLNGDQFRFFVRNFNQSVDSPIFISRPTKSGVLRSTGTNVISVPTIVGENRYGLFVSSQFLTGSFNGTIYIHSLNSSAGNNINSDYLVCGSDTGMSIPIGWTKICELNHTVEAGDSSLLYLDSDLDSVLPAEFIIRINSTDANYNLTYHRDTTSNDMAHISIRDMITNLTESTEYKFDVSIYSDVAATLYSMPISIVDSNQTLLIDIPSSPIGSIITYPFEGTEVSIDTGLKDIEWLDFLSPGGFDINYTVGIKNSTSDYEWIINDTQSTNVEFNFSNLDLGDHNIIVIGCTDDLCSNVTSLFEIIEPPLAPEELACKQINERMSDAFDLGVIGLIVLAMVLVITVVGGLATGVDSKVILASATTLVTIGLFFGIGVIVFFMVSGKLC